MHPVKFSLTVMCFMLSTSAYCQWKQNEFILGAFHEPKAEFVNGEISETYQEKLQRAKDAYFNLFTNTFSGCDKLPSEQFLKVLDKNNKAGMNTMFTIYIVNNNSEKYKSITTLNLFKTPIYGWFIKDEPSLIQADSMRRCMQYFKQRSETKLGYINLLPMYGFKSEKEYSNYLDKYLSDSDLRVISYDYYPFHERFFKSSYFTNLQMVTERANGRPVWTYALTTKHWDYVDPGQYHLYFMTFCPLTYGTKGIIYYSYETMTHSHIHYENAIIDSMENPTKKYSIVQDINRFISQVAGPIIMNSKYIGTYHVSDAPFNNEQLDPKYLLNANTPLIYTISNTNVVTGIFRDNQDTSTYYLFVVNKDKHSYKKNFISLAENPESSISVSKPVSEFREGDVAFTDIPVKHDLDNNEMDIQVDFEPGELRILKITHVINLSTDREGRSLSLISFPNPTSGRINLNFTLEEDSNVDIDLFNSLGTFTSKILSNAYLNKGNHILEYDLTNLNKGIYFVRISTKSAFKVSEILKE